MGRGEASRGPGTTVEVADLFFNTPARRKFLNTSAGELRAALRLLEALGLAFPRIALRLVTDAKERFDWPAVTGEGLAVDARGSPRCGGRDTPSSGWPSPPSATAWCSRRCSDCPSTRADPRGPVRVREPALDPEPARGSRAPPGLRRPAAGRSFSAGGRVAARAARSPRCQRPPDQARGALRRRGHDLRAGGGRERSASGSPPSALHGGIRHRSGAALGREGGGGAARADRARPGVVGSSGRGARTRGPHGAEPRDRARGSSTAPTSSLPCAAGS